MNPWPVKLPASASLSDAVEAFLEAKGYQHVDDDECGVILPAGELYARDGEVLKTSIADLELKPDSRVKVVFALDL